MATAYRLKKARAMLLSCLLGLISHLTACTRDEQPNQVLKSWGIEADFPPDWKNQRRIAANAGEEFRAERQGAILRAERLSAKDAKSAENYLKNRIWGIMRLYDTSPEPYLGYVTRTVECPTAYKPVILIEKANAHQIISLYANSALNYGVCNKQQAAYKVTLTTLFCERTGQIFWIEYFVPDVIAGKESAAKILKCL